MPSVMPENSRRNSTRISAGPSAFIVSSMNGATSTATRLSGRPMLAKRWAAPVLTP
jgi:hypothetical protein